VYHNIKALYFSLKYNQFYKDEEYQNINLSNVKGSIISDQDPNFYKNYLRAYRANMTENLQNVFSTLNYSVIALLKKVKYMMGRIEKKEAIRQIESSIVTMSDDDASPTTPSTTPTTTPSRTGGKHTRNNKKSQHSKTRKIRHGGTPLKDKRDVIIDKMAKYLYVENLKNERAKNNYYVFPELLEYVKEEQYYFIKYAIECFEKNRTEHQLDTSEFDMHIIETEEDYNKVTKNIFDKRKELDEYLGATEKTTENILKLIGTLSDLAFGTNYNPQPPTPTPPHTLASGGDAYNAANAAYKVATAVGNRLIIQPARAVGKSAAYVASEVPRTAAYAASIGYSLGMEKHKRLNRCFDFSFKCMVFYRTKKIYPEISADKFEKKREQVLDFLKEVSWCIMMSSHFTCSTLVNFSTMANPISMMIKGIPLVGHILSHVGIQSPQCYISGIFLLTLLYHIQPFSLDILRGIDSIEEKMKEKEKNEQDARIEASKIPSTATTL
jgi:hypothetical protein